MRTMVLRTGVVLILVCVLGATLATTSDAAGKGSQRVYPRSYRLEAFPGEYLVGLKTGRVLGRAEVRAAGVKLASRPARGLLHIKQASRAEVATIEADPAVSFVEPNYVRHLSEVVPNDTNFVHQWGFRNTGQAHMYSGGGTATAPGTADADMDVTEAWDVTQGSEDTVVAILDSGVDVLHPDLAANLWVNDGEIADNDIDDDGNGYKDDVYGYDFADRDDTLLEPNTTYVGYDHGTHVAGTVAAVANNGVGVAGVCPNCKIMVLKIFKPFDTDDDGLKDTMLGSVAAGIKAVNYARKMGADIINGSLGASLSWSKSERLAYKQAQAAGVTMVFAAGNENGDNDLTVLQDFDNDQVPDSLSPSFPASYDLSGIIAVAASNDDDENGFSSVCEAQTGSGEWPCSFTNWGHTSVDVSAPGVDVISTVPGGYSVFDGTSMATPHVAGLAGLVKSAHPDYTPVQIKNAIMNSVDHPSSLGSLLFWPDRSATGVFTVTGGRANAHAALTASTANATPSHDGSIARAKSITSSTSGSVTWPDDANDVFKKKLTKGVKYRVKLNGAAVPQDLDLDLAVYLPGITEIWQWESGCVGGPGQCLMNYRPTESADESLTFVAPRGGTYYFHVSAYLFQAGDYTLSVAKV